MVQSVLIPQARAQQRSHLDQESLTAFETLPVGDVEFGPNNSEGMTFIISCKHPSSRQHPDPIAGFRSGAIFDLVLRGESLQVILQRFFYSRPIIGMDAGTPGVDMRLDLVGAKTTHFAPS